MRYQTTSVRNRIEYQSSQYSLFLLLWKVDTIDTIQTKVIPFHKQNRFVPSYKQLKNRVS